MGRVPAVGCAALAEGEAAGQHGGHCTLILILAIPACACLSLCLRGQDFEFRLQSHVEASLRARCSLLALGFRVKHLRLGFKV